MVDHCLLFLREKYNKNSIAALCGAIENKLFLERLGVYFCRSKDLAAKTRECLAAHKSVILAVSFCTTNLIDIHNLVSSLNEQLDQEERSRLALVAGGPHPSGNFADTIAMGFDYVVTGEGELAFPALLSALLSGKNCDGIKSIAYASEGGPIHTGKPAKQISLDDYPPFSVKYRKFGPIEITRGCPWGCRYCQTPFLFGGKMRHRSVDNIATYAEVLRSQGMKDLRFITPDAFAYGSDGRTPDLGAVERLLRSVSEIFGRRHVYFGSFPSEVRPDLVSEEAVDLVRRYAANDNLVIGAQSGSRRMLDKMHRGHSVEDVYKAAEIVTKAGLIANIDFIFGLPGEEEKDRELTFRLIERLTQLGSRIHSHTFIPLPGTPLADAPPGSVDRGTAEFLAHLASAGKQFGSWRRQEQIGKALQQFKGIPPIPHRM